jgi:Translation initiation factor IF-3, C-terminal domain.
MQHTDIAYGVVADFLNMLDEQYKVDKPAKLEGRTITTFISPVSTGKR